jgi:hypothetical protein
MVRQQGVSVLKIFRIDNIHTRPPQSAPAVSYFTNQKRVYMQLLPADNVCACVPISSYVRQKWPTKTISSTHSLGRKSEVPVAFSAKWNNNSSNTTTPTP